MTRFDTLNPCPVGARGQLVALSTNQILVCFCDHRDEAVCKMAGAFVTKEDDSSKHGKSFFWYNVDLTRLGKWLAIVFTQTL